MNAVIGVCHFCELHGPSVLFCTQAFHDQEKPSKCSLSADVKNPKSYYGNSELMHSVGDTLKSESCEGCSSMTGSRRRFLSNDHGARVSYISSQYPLNSDIFSIVRQACVRSLSCEVCPGREGPIYFGDDRRGHVLSHTFFMKDSQARGFQRWYSIMVVMTDKIHLLNSWPFIVRHLQQIISELQEKAAKVYEGEQSEDSQRSIRLNSVTRMTPDNFRRQRGNAKARSLVELTGDSEIFAYMHLWFTWLLRAGACRLSERLFEGLPSEDTVVDVEKQEETEEGFIQVHLKKVPDEFRETLRGISSSLGEGEGSLSGVKSLRELYQAVGPDMFRVLAYHTLIGNQIILRGDCADAIRSIFLCLKGLLPRGCFCPLFFSPSYEDSWKFNFLGLPSDTPVPGHVLSSDLHLCIDVRLEDGSRTAEGPPFVLTLHHCATLPEKLPQVLMDAEKALQNTDLSEGTLEALMTSIKETWMNKVKVLFTYSRAGQHPAEDTQRLLHVLGAQEHDKQMLKFWMTGLSTQYKTHVLSSSVQGASREGYA